MFSEGGLSNVAENLQKAWLDKIPSRLIGLVQITLVTIATYLNQSFKNLYIAPEDLLQVESKISRDMDIALLESVSTDASDMAVPVIQPLQNQVSL